MELLLRSMLFVTAHNEKYITKAITTDADALIMDMEDSVPEDCKSLAQTTLKASLSKGLFSNKTVFVRTNVLESEYFIKDVDAAIHKDIFGFMPPKIQSQDDIIFLDKLLTQKEKASGIPFGHFKLAPLIETAASVLNLSEIIRQNKRIVAIAFGGEDFLNDLHGTHGSPPIAFDVPRALIAMAARSAGVAPIDTPYLDISDEEGFIREKKNAYELGFSGALLVNPKQILIANNCFMPSEKDVAHAQEIIAAIQISKNTGAGCVMLGDQMIGPPMQRKAEQIVSFMHLVNRAK